MILNLHMNSVSLIANECNLLVIAKVQTRPETPVLFK